MFVRADYGSEVGGAGGRVFGRASDTSFPAPEVAGLVVNLAAAIGSSRWWRGLATLAALCWAAWVLMPERSALPMLTPPPLTDDEAESARALAIAPLGRGARAGHLRAPTALARAVAFAPTRPTLDLSITLDPGETIATALARAGVADAAPAAALLATGAGQPLAAGTTMAATLGPRTGLGQRPLQHLAVRARFDLTLRLDRAGDRLVLTRAPIATDRTPLRLRGLVGPSLFRSARAAGVPLEAVANYIQAIATRISIGQDILPTDRFDLVIARERTAAGEERLGPLLMAALDQGDHRLTLVRWRSSGQDNWFDAAGEIHRPGPFGMPVAGRITSGFGMRFHPLLGFTRMHKGIDIGAPVGTPVYAILDGTVLSAGWSGGYGNFIRLAHGAGMATGYGHLSRLAVAAGQRVQRGQVIGFVGSTGLSTGPHLHWEVTRGGAAINPLSLTFENVSSLAGTDMPGFRARVAQLEAVAVGR
jgi:murein DD-endopeptidase MepM/ murein hydrolase activator NlpD